MKETLFENTISLRFLLNTTKASEKSTDGIDCLKAQLN